MKYLRYCVFMPLLLLAAEIYGEDAFLVSNGILAVDANALRDIGIDIIDEDGQAMKGVIVFRAGLSVSDANKQSRTIAGSVYDLDCLLASMTVFTVTCSLDVFTRWA